MKKNLIFFLSIIFCHIPLFSVKLSDYVAQAVGLDETSDDIKNKALFLTKSLQINNHPDAKLAYYFLSRSKYFNKDKAALDKALAEISMAAPANASQYQGHQGPQAIDDMITMFTAGPGSAIYKKLAPTHNKQAIDTIVSALENTKSMLN